MDAQNTSSRAAKRLRTLSETDNPLLKPEIQRLIVSFVTAADLCRWDLVCRDFLLVSKSQWGILAHSRFGASPSGGKEAWKLGASLMKEPILLDFEENEDFGNGGGYAGSPCCATNQSLLVTVSDDIDNIWREDHKHFPVGPNGISIRDAETLNFFRNISSPIVNWRVTICGKMGCEILVTSNNTQFCAIRGKTQQVWTQASVVEEGSGNLETGASSAGNGIPLLGCETHVITVAWGGVYLYDVEAPDGSLVKLKMSLPISEEELRTGVAGRRVMFTTESLAWSPCKTHFVFCVSEIRSLFIWKFDSVVGSIHPVKKVSTDDLNIAKVVLSDNYVVGADGGKVLHVWSRQTGELCHGGLCDVPSEQQVDPEHLFDSLSMIVVTGDLMVTSSNQGAALCIWNLNKGDLLTRHTDAFDQFSEELPNGIDVTTMVYLQGLNSFACIQWFMMAWAFPTDKIMKERILSIRRRERNIKRVLMNLQQGEMKGDDWYMSHDDGDY